jgi:hypothetical protein
MIGEMNTASLILDCAGIVWVVISVREMAKTLISKTGQKSSHIETKNVRFHTI